MTDPVTPPPAAPATPAPATTAAPLAAPPAPPPAAPSATDDDLPKVGEPGWLKARTDRAEEKGRKAARKESKEERRAIKEAGKEATALKATAQAELDAANRAADAILAQVPEAERNSILTQAGTSPTKKLELFAVWQLAKGVTPLSAQPTPAPATSAAPPAPAAPQVAPQPLAPPATSAAPPAAPPPPPTQAGAEDHRANYEALKQTNPYLASQYLLNHEAEIFPVRTFDQVPKRA